MKRSKVMSVLTALALAVPVAGCGGGGSSGNDSSKLAVVGGTINVSYIPPILSNTLLLVNNGADIIAVQQLGSFAFDKKLKASSAYNVTLYRQPTGLYCIVSNGTGTIDQNANDIANISVTCEMGIVTLQRYDVGVTVSGLLPGNSVTFLNNGIDTLTANDNGLFVFPKTYVMESAPLGITPGAYAVTVLSYPAGQTCTLQNASGLLSSPSDFSDFVNVIATCQ